MSNSKTSVINVNGGKIEFDLEHRLVRLTDKKGATFALDFEKFTGTSSSTSRHKGQVLSLACDVIYRSSEKRRPEMTYRQKTRPDPHSSETTRTLRDRLTQAELKRSQLTQDAKKATQRSQLTHLTAPVTGTVQQLAVHTAGGVVTPAQVLLIVVPDGAEMTAEVTVENKDVGFVQENQTATIKLETFPFTRYGTISATVQRISADAVVDEKRGALFPAMLTLGSSALNVDGKKIQLAPGMNLTAEIKTGRRRVIDYLVSPLRQVTSESLRER